MVHFWASEVTESKAAVVKVPEGFVLNVCNATLASDAASVVSLGLETAQLDRKSWKGVVAHLGAAAHAHQVKLDLVFGGAAPQVKFYVAKGAGKINLTGYFQPGPPADLFDAVPSSSTVASSTSTSKQSSKKRARDEQVTWDQAASTSDSDSDDEPKSASKPAVTPSAPKQQKKEPQQQKKKEQKKPQQTMPAANGSHTNSTPATDGSAKKKHRNKKKNKLVDKASA